MYDEALRAFYRTIELPKGSMVYNRKIKLYQCNPNNVRPGRRPCDRKCTKKRKIDLKW